MTSTITPVDLTCEYRENPLGIDETTPRFGWRLSGEGRGLLQSAYRLSMAFREDDLLADRNLLWESGDVSSSETVGVEYAGPPLESGRRYYWRVRVTDGDGEVSGASEAAYFEMGLLDPSEWRGRWISLGPLPDDRLDPPTGESYDPIRDGLSPARYLRRRFEIEGPVASARVYATARGVYDLHLNGERVSDTELSPGWTDYDRRIHYQTFDLTDRLTEGENVIGAVLGDGWYSGFVGFDPRRRGAHYGSTPSFLAEIEIRYEDGRTERISTDTSWRSSVGPILYSDLLMGELYDAREEMPGWNSPGFDDENWRPVSVEAPGNSRLQAQPDEGVRATEILSPVAITEPEPGVYVFDLGQNIVGRPRLKVNGPSGTEVTLRHAEVLDADGSLYTENLRFARAEDRYILSGTGEEVFEPRFTFHGFRYVEVRGYPGRPTGDDLAGVVLHSDTHPTGKFDCSSDLVSKLQENIVRGQRGNFLSIPTDCPQRDERLGWMGDAQIFVRTASFNMDVAAFFEKWMTDVRDAQSEDGCFPDVAPLPGTGGNVNLASGAPAWGDAGVIVPWTIYRVYGDRRIVERNYDAMRLWMDYLRRHNPDLIRRNALGNNYGDWLSPHGDDTPRELLATAYWAYDATLMAEMAAAIGREDEARGYSELKRMISAAFVQEFAGDHGRLDGDTQTAYCLSLHMDLLPDETRSVAAGHLVRALEREDWHLATGFVGVGYLLPVLTEAGRHDIAYRILNNTTYPSWGYTILNGATTIWERWDGWTETDGFQSPNMNSFNHYSLGSVGEWLYRYVAGLDLAPDATGFERVVIRPIPGGGLTYASATYDSIRGEISSEWETSENRLKLHVVIPPNVRATVVIPTNAPEQVTESGESLADAEGIEAVESADGAVKVEIGSGTYEFEANV